MSKPTCYRKVKTYNAPAISEPSEDEARAAHVLALLNDKLEETAYKYVADSNGQLRLLLKDDIINNSSYWKALEASRLLSRTSASQDSEQDKTCDDPFFKTLAKVNKYSTYGMYTTFDAKQLTIDDVLKEDK